MQTLPGRVYLLVRQYLSINLGNCEPACLCVVLLHAYAGVVRPPVLQFWWTLDGTQQYHGLLRVTDSMLKLSLIRKGIDKCANP